MKNESSEECEIFPFWISYYNYNEWIVSRAIKNGDMTENILVTFENS